MTALARLGYDAAAPLFHIGGAPPRLTVRPGEFFETDSEDAFGGRVTASDARPREVAPFPFVNPLTGPVEIAGARPGDGLAVHIVSVEPLRSWGVSTQSPGFGLLSGNADFPNTQPPVPERVWIWHLDAEAGALVTGDDPPLRVPFRPFLGTVGVAPPHDEVRNSVVPGPFGGNLDLPLLGAGTTLYLRVNIAGGGLVVGDGHLAQGDGELAGTAVEGAVRTRLVCEVLPPGTAGFWPRLETSEHFVTVGCSKPLESAFAIAAHEMVQWVTALSGLPVAEALQLISQSATTRVGNLVNPQYSAALLVPKSVVPRADVLSAHDRLARLAGR
jgi:acetamidase/formamidase